MSFSSEVKKELLDIKDLDDDHQKALLFGLLLGTSDLMLTSRGIKIICRSTLLNVLKVMLPMLKSRYNLNIGLSYKTEPGLLNRRYYFLEIIDHAEEIMNDFHLIPYTHISRSDPLIHSESLKGAFLRGLFVAHGSINDPRKECYHLEITAPSLDQATLIKKIFKIKNIEAKIIERGNKYVCYIKKSEHISSALAYLGASSGVFYFEDSRILRDLNNMANRMSNCDIANEVRCAKSCDEQLQAIEYIRETGQFEKMPVRLQSIAKLREDYPDSSFEELSLYSDNVFGKQLSKSGITHCMRALMNFYKDLIKQVK